MHCSSILDYESLHEMLLTVLQSGTIMKSLLILFLVIALAIYFTTDPIPPVPEDTTDRIVDMHLYDTFLQ
jgi:hypothetical protein